ncbi:MAG TPA: beta-galactosidase [Chthonomonadaceae bacterium]|nr:beta-galactosidase [Chthonomonadaceae bacterium]
MNPLLLAILCILTGGPQGKQPPSALSINSFETVADLQLLKAANTRLTPTPQHATDGKQALQVEFQPAEWPNVLFAPETPWDWSGYGGLALDVTNPGQEALQFYVRIDDDKRADGVVHCRTGNATIEPGKTATFTVSFGPDPMAVGMRGLPGPVGTREMGANGSGPFDLHHIVAFQLFMHRPDATKTLIVDNVRLIPSRDLTHIVDAFGQYTKADWPGKVHAVADMNTRAEKEREALHAAPALPGRDRFGGWADGPKEDATGFFRTRKVDGKWWLVDPDGRLFLSFGLDDISLNYRTFTTGREQMFTWLPEKGDPLAHHAGYQSNIHSGPIKEGADFCFLTANLERTFGKDYAREYFDEALARIPAWGFNTVANWSDWRFYRNGKVPYVATGGIGGDHARVSSGSDYWGKMHDPFDPQFAKDVEASLKGLTAQVKGDPWCLGYFVDNELSWGGEGEEGGRYGLALGTLAETETAPAKAALLAQLKAKYPDIAALDAAWGTTFADWNALNAPYKPGKLTDAQKIDMAAFVKALARKYFGTIRDALKQADPDHLYLGCRFAWKTQDAVAAAAEICDVISFNIYAPHIRSKEWDNVVQWNKPCIIGEFHFGALDRGMFHPGLVATPNQAARGAMYRDYVESVVDNPAFVGCHWFEYTDEPLTGRVWDGENYNVGFVSVTDTPYPEMVAAAKQVHAEAYTRRAGKH